MLNRFFLEKIGRLKPSFKGSQAFLSGLSLTPHSEEHLMHQEFILKIKQLPYEKRHLEKGSRILMCNSMFQHHALVDTRPTYLKKDHGSLIAAKDDFRDMYQKFNANLIEFELKADLNCFAVKIKPERETHFIHLQLLKKIQIYSIPEIIALLEDIESKMQTKSLGPKL